MIRALALDFETYFDRDYSLRKLAIPEFVLDPRFRVHGLAIRYPEGHCEFAWNAGAALATLQVTYGPQLERIPVLMHNAYFDGYILARHFGLVPRFPIDTQQIGAAVFGRKTREAKGQGVDLSLGALAERLALPPKGEIEPFLGVREFTEPQRRQMEEYALQDVRLTYEIADQLLPRLSRPEVELRIAAHTLLLHNARGIPVDTAAIDPILAEAQGMADAACRAAGVEPAVVSSNTQFNAALSRALARTGRAVPQKYGKRGPIPATAKNDPAMQALRADADPAVAALARARVEVNSAHQTISRLEALKERGTRTGGILPVHLVFHGAHTGRFSGGGGINMQNLPKSGLGKRIRSLFMAPPGHKLVVIDLAQIEARVLAGVAGEERQVRAFAEGRDLYSEEASVIFGREVRKPLETDTPAAASLLDGMRQTGKREVLGLGYQMGARKFMATLRQEPACAALFASGELTAQRGVATVSRYRATFPAIPRLWAELEAGFLACASGQREFACRQIGIEAADGGVALVLPSGRRLRYANTRIVERSGTIRYLDEDGDEADFEASGPGVVYGAGEGVGLYGGLITENAIQAIARDILVEAVLRAEDRGVRIVSHVHDEIIAVSPHGVADQTLAVLREELTRQPPWLPGVPLGADGWVRDRYGK